MKQAVDSVIKKNEIGEEEIVLSWKRPGSDASRYSYALFCLIALIFNFFLTMATVNRGSSSFLAMFLNVFLVFSLIQLLRPQRRESIIIKKDTFDYDSGTVNILNYNKSKRYRVKVNGLDLWKKLLAQRKVIGGIRKEKSLLRFDESPQLISFEYNLKRIEIGSCLSEDDLMFVWHHLR